MMLNIFFQQLIFKSFSFTATDKNRDSSRKRDSLVDLYQSGSIPEEQSIWRNFLEKEANIALSFGWQLGQLRGRTQQKSSFFQVQRLK